MRITHELTVPKAASAKITFYATVKECDEFVKVMNAKFAPGSVPWPVWEFVDGVRNAVAKAREIVVVETPKP